MKMKNLLLFVIGMFIVNASHTAELTIYNETGRDPVFGTVRWFNTWKKQQVNQNYNISKAVYKMHISTGGAHPFIELEWVDGNNVYAAGIPSSKMMLMGSVVLRPNGFYSINFDQNGASDRAMKTEQAILLLK